ncbi:MAG: prepilin-type N-terminal cleavage/methylation domain-containing protein [Clostridia bacterium]|nr:prepilin-type N-terminal cleavage/methylation domain-containing protein [Clostridia bacterium]MBQ6646720.1 prepilin-type N-terminal cleavage/methylation domain-containing protein [Clostridia bacterium]
MKKNNKRGFTLAELLIVVAIIAVLVAIAIPVFTTQLEKSRQSTDLANIRAAYATLVANYLETDGTAADPIQVQAKKTKAWLDGIDAKLYVMVKGQQAEVTVPANVTATGSKNIYYVSIDADGKVSVTDAAPSGGGD